MLNGIHLPDQLIKTLRPQEIIAENLLNPRGICQMEDGRLIVLEAGSGKENETFSGRISLLRPSSNNNGRYLPREDICTGFRSMNMQNRMYRDEIMGLSDVSNDGGYCLVSQTDYIEGSKILDIKHTPPKPLFYSQGNLNSLCYHPKRKTWFAIKPDLDVLVEFNESKEEKIIAKLPKCSQAQDAVPVTLCYEAATGSILISLFSGELFSNSERKGIDFASKAGKIIRIYPDNGKIETLITGLQFPTGIAFRSSQQLLVLELCDQLLEPLTENWAGKTLHGGYARFSGRLLNIDLNSGDTKILAEKLDTPSNLCLLPNDIVLISEGMGLCGRPVPTTSGRAEPLTGRIRRVDLKG